MDVVARFELKLVSTLFWAFAIIRNRGWGRNCYGTDHSFRHLDALFSIGKETPVIAEWKSASKQAERYKKTVHHLRQEG